MCLHQFFGVGLFFGVTKCPFILCCYAFSFLKGGLFSVIGIMFRSQDLGASVFIAFNLRDTFDSVFDILLHSLFCIVTISDLAYTFIVISRPSQWPLTSFQQFYSMSSFFFSSTCHLLTVTVVFFLSFHGDHLNPIPRNFGKPLVVIGKIFLFCSFFHQLGFQNSSRSMLEFPGLPCISFWLT